MRPDILIVEMTAQEQRRYLSQDATSGARLPNLRPNMPSGKAGQEGIVEGSIVLRRETKSSWKRKKHNMQRWRQH